MPKQTTLDFQENSMQPAPSRNVVYKSDPIATTSKEALVTMHQGFVGLWTDFAEGEGFKARIRLKGKPDIVVKAFNYLEAKSTVFWQASEVLGI